MIFYPYTTDCSYEWFRPADLKLFDPCQLCVPANLLCDNDSRNKRMLLTGSVRFRVPAELRLQVGRSSIVNLGGTPGIWHKHLLMRLQRPSQT